MNGPLLGSGYNCTELVLYIPRRWNGVVELLARRSGFMSGLRITVARNLLVTPAPGGYDCVCKHRLCDRKLSAMEYELNRTIDQLSAGVCVCSYLRNVCRFGVRKRVIVEIITNSFLTRSGSFALCATAESAQNGSSPTHARSRAERTYLIRS